MHLVEVVDRATLNPFESLLISYAIFAHFVVVLILLLMFCFGASFLATPPPPTTPDASVLLNYLKTSQAAIPGLAG